MPETVVEYLKRLSEYGWGSVIFQMLLIGAALYAVSGFLRGTRGLRLMRGLIVTLISAFLILDVLAARLQLEQITVLFKPFVYMIFFASLVAFQPELRRGLIRLGEARWLQRFIHGGEQTIGAVSSAVRQLAGQRVGALIAIERQVGLGSIIENGVRIDGVVSAELLRTIFRPGSALHDLGVVIQEGRLAAAACQFPLTESDQFDPGLGSRHRAAVGLTEDSDAVVVVVSEETGTISLAVEGRLHRGLTPNALAQELKELLQVKDKNGQ